MNLSQIVTFYLNMNLLVAAVYCGLWIVESGLKKWGLSLPHKINLQLHYQIILILFICAFGQLLLPQAEFYQAPVKIWSAIPYQSSVNPLSNHEDKGYLTISSAQTMQTMDTETLTLVWTVICGVLLFLGVCHLMLQIWQLHKLKQKSFLIRKIGRVNIRISEQAQIPFSFYLGSAFVVLPASMMTKPRQMRLAVMHELQHHRQKDTVWIYLILGLNLFCFANPFIRLWSRWISEVQEFACDEALVDHKKVSSLAYASCLLEVAQTTRERVATPACATGFICLFQQNILKRRIENMFSQTKPKTKRSMRALILVIMASLLTTVSYASKGFIQDRRVTMSEALEYGKRAQDGSAFPIVVNERVLKQLNRYIGTPEGREFMRKSLVRMENYKEMVRDKLSEYGTPVELMAIPLVESGYQNLAPQYNKVKAAGLWQFIASTARIYGLRVDQQVDERMQPEILTDAAMRYLLSNRLRFKDWQLSVLAYNVGESAVQKGIDKLGSKNPWDLIENGIENDTDYLPRVMAAIIIMKNPGLVN